MKCIKVEKNRAEETKKMLIKEKAMSKGYRPVIGRKYLYFPVTKKIEGYIIEEKDCEKIVKEELPSHSFDQIGSIIILGENVPTKDAKEYLKIKSAKTILRKKGIHHGEFRTQDMQLIAGVDTREAIHKENGVQIKLNVEKCYFSVRLSTERRRIASLIKDNESILVLFSGSGPYPLVIAKHANPKLIIGVEKNPIAHKYAIHNCRKHRNIALFNMDAKEFTYKEKFDRILMPLPKSSADFLPVTKNLIKKGGTIHFYDFGHEKDFPQEAINKIKKTFPKAKTLESVKCGQYGPGRFRICIDFKA